MVSSENSLAAPVSDSRLSASLSQTVKRALDICASLSFLVVVFPAVLLIVGLAIWLADRGPVFFRQRRKGYHQNTFTCYKFRTMKVDTPIDESIQAQPDDPRVTAVGRLLRRTSMDELPQLLNVLLGHMSLVGPRPHMLKHDEFYERTIDLYTVRSFARPGMTGWAQVNGLRGPTDDPDLMKKRVDYDIWYINNWSLLLDLKIIWRTGVLVLTGDKNAF